ncbi:hypothetical protein QQP08_005470 [Theobroma cacao]|nr:hypothetical protein QQP08_005470 [Theobroma cacao]
MPTQLKEELLENCQRDDFQLDVAEPENENLVLENQASNQEVALRSEQSLKAKKQGPSLVVFLKLAVSAFLGDPSLFISAMFQINQ